MPIDVLTVRQSNCEGSAVVGSLGPMEAGIPTSLSLLLLVGGEVLYGCHVRAS